METSIHEIQQLKHDKKNKLFEYNLQLYLTISTLK